MNKKILILGGAIVTVVAIIIIVILSLSKGTPLGNTIQGNGTLTKKEQTLSQFLSLDVKLPIKVTVKQSTNNNINLTLDQNLADCVSLTDTDRKITISTKKCFDANNQSLSFSEQANIEIETTNVERIAASNGAIVSLDINPAEPLAHLTLVANTSSRILGKINVSILDAYNNGSGNQELSGAAKEINLSLLGSGSFKAYELNTTVATVILNNSGSAQMSVSSVLRVSGTGSGTVSYKGDPTTSVSLSGPGKVQKTK